MRIAVCDDYVDDALFLQKKLAGQEVSIYSDAESLWADAEEKNMRYDLYMLDIFIEGSMNGLELAKKLREVQEEAMICFVSASNDFYREAYDLYAIQYLIKPVREESINGLLQKVQRNLEWRAEKEKTLSYSWWGVSGVIPYGKIRYISTKGHALTICCEDGRIQESTGKLNDLERQICGDIFMRCHQSFIVNIHHVDSMVGAELMIEDESIPVSRRYYAEVKKRYQKFLFEEVD